MTNRYPLIIDSSTQRIVELPTSDNLDLSGSSISSVTEITTTGNVYIGDELTITNQNDHGGAGIAGIMTMTNANVSATNPNKFVRLDIGGSIQIINSDYTTQIFELTDDGEMSVPTIQLNKYYEQVYGMGTVSGTVSPDLNNGSIQSLILNGDITMNSITNMLAGSSMTLIISQDSSGSRTLTSSWKFAGASNTLSTDANATDIISLFYDGSFYYATLSKGYA